MRVRQAVAIVAAALAVQGVLAADDFSFFPTNSFVQCVLDAKAIAAFPPLARMAKATGAEAALTGTLAATPKFGESVSFYALAAMPMKDMASKPHVADNEEEEDDEYEYVLFIGFTNDVSVASLGDAFSEMIAMSAVPGTAPTRIEREILPGDVLRVVMPDKHLDGNDDSDAPVTIYFAHARDALVAVSSQEALVRVAAAEVMANRTFCPNIPGKRPFFWISAQVEPAEMFGDDDEDDDISFLSVMPFLKDMKGVVVCAEGMGDDDSVSLSIVGKFANAQSASAAGAMVAPLLQMAALPRVGAEGGPLAALVSRTKVESVDGECRISAKLSFDEIQSIIGLGITEEGAPD